MTRRTLGVVGARGYVGRELLDLVAAHDGLDLRLVTSQKDSGRRVAEDVPRLASDLTYQAPSPDAAAALALDAYVLALPNGASAPWVAAIGAACPDAVIVDLGADHRFDPDWIYGQPERQRAAIRGARRIANPGCYATAMQLALWPLVADLVEAHVFGVSGYSGAGTTPSEKNDPAVLEDNLLPYALTGHVHEREVSRQLGRPVFFVPHVAPFFRGITVTVSARLRSPTTAAELRASYTSAFADEPLVVLDPTIPRVRDVRGRHEVFIGPAEVGGDGTHVVVVATIDNLLGGAATQALRNVNLALGLDERRGL